jgi:two-component system, OmpR family, sensor kinase
VHSLFTRIFLSFWAAIVLIASGAVALTAINFAAGSGRPAAITSQAAEVLKRDGLAGLRTWLAEHNRRNRGQRTLIIDSNGQDILGQKLPDFRGGGPPGPPPFGGGPRPPPPDEAAGPSRSQPPDRGPPGMPPDRGNRDSDAVGAGPDRGSSDNGAIAGPPDRGPPMGPFGPGGFRGPPGSLIRGADGAEYRVIFDPPPRQGPFSPPFSWSVRVGLLVLALGVSGLISYLLARSISNPVRRLQAAAHTLSSGKLDARAGPEVAERRDELGVLGREFDSMAERLSALIAARQRLLRDISHELRSPLARMEMAIGLARQDPASTPEQIDRIEREAERLDRLIGHILDYARLERDPATFDFEEVDLVELTRQILHDAEFESQSPPGRLRFTPDEDSAILRGDPHVLHAAIDNVVRNALIHGDVRMPIKVSLVVDAESFHVSIRDHGPGVPDAELARIFEPFYRAGSLDSKHVSTEGTGVGLAITQRAVALHGGHVVARNAEGGGLLVTLTLPRKFVFAARH